MPTLTTRLGFARPLAADPADLPAALQPVVDKLDTDMAVDGQGTLAARPAAGVRGRYYYATDTGLVYRDNATTWTVVGALATAAAASASAVGDAAAVGASTDYARSDHKHGREAFGGAVASEVAFGVATGVGVALTPARSDHSHGSASAAAPGSSAPGDAIAEGASGTLARSDHRHGREAFGGAGVIVVAGGASAAGAAGSPSRSDHVHGLGAAAAPAASAPGDAVAIGVSTSVARADHLHPREAFGGSGAAGTVSRGDHHHTVRLPHTWTVGGEVRVPVGDTDYINPVPVPASLVAGRSPTAVAASHRINSGLSVTVTLQKRSPAGVVTAIQAGIVVVPGAVVTTAFAGVALSTDDHLELVVTAVAGTPRNLSFAVQVDYPVAM